MQLWLILAINDFKFWHLTNFETHPSLVELPAAPSNSRHSCHRHFFYNLCPSFFTLWTFFRSPSSPLASFSKWGKAEQRRKRRLSKPDFLCIHFNSRASCSSLDHQCPPPKKVFFGHSTNYLDPQPPGRLVLFLNIKKQCFCAYYKAKAKEQFFTQHACAGFAFLHGFNPGLNNSQLSNIDFWKLSSSIKHSVQNKTPVCFNHVWLC